MSEDNPRVLVMGVGNILMRDEGVGNRIAVELQRNYRLPDDVRVMDAGTMGLGMLHLFRGLDYLLIADALDGTGHPAGTVLHVPPDEFSPNQVLHSLHDVRLVDVLAAASLIGIMPETDCVGVQVADMSPEELTIGLSEPVEAALPRAIAAVLWMLGERGVIAHPADQPDGDTGLQALVAAHLGDIRRRRSASS